MPEPSLQDFSLINTHVKKITSELNLKDSSSGFYFFILEHILNLQEDEASDSITDTSFLLASGKRSGHDRGIDAIFIDDSLPESTIHIFNCKYTSKFENTRKHFPSVEIDKILGFLRALISKNKDLKQEVNEILFQKVGDIWRILSDHNPKFIIHICGNMYKEFEKQEKTRFERDINNYSNISIQYHLMIDLVGHLTRQGKRTVNAKIKAIDKNLFEKSGGDIRALIVEIDTRDLLRIVVDDDGIRNEASPNNYDFLLTSDILEDAFEDNVRIYLRQRSKINRNIKDTALSSDSHRFFYFNNGITITCKHFSYPKSQRAPIIELENLQIVNGCQTIHALHEAYLADSGNSFEDMEVLCRIYETQNEELSTNIAEFTNSQNPVKSRDIRSNDFVQKKLESELKAMGYYYERKKGQYFKKSREKRIDAEKAGQAIMAFWNEMPAEAKNDKRLIFAEKYDDVFSDDVTAETILVAISIYKAIEKAKLIRKAEILNNPSKFEENSFILHATYYILYMISRFADVLGIEKNLKNINDLNALYDRAFKAIQSAVKKEISLMNKKAETYSHRHFFKGNRPKIILGLEF